MTAKEFDRFTREMRVWYPELRGVREKVGSWWLYRFFIEDIPMAQDTRGSWLLSWMACSHKDGGAVVMNEATATISTYITDDQFNRILRESSVFFPDIRAVLNEDGTYRYYITEQPMTTGEAFIFWSAWSCCARRRIEEILLEVHGNVRKTEE